jgi:hypothetical protein
MLCALVYECAGEIDVGFCALDQLSWSEGSGGARFDVLIPHIKTGLRYVGC